MCWSTKNTFERNSFQQWMECVFCPFIQSRTLNEAIYNCTNVKIWRYPSILYLCLSCTHTLPHFASSGHKAAGAHPSSLGVKMGLHSGQVTNSLQGQWEKQPSTIVFSPWANLELPVSLTCMPLDCGRKPEYLERSHADTRRTCRLHTGGSDSNSWPSYSIQTTALSCHPNLIFSSQDILNKMF